MLATALSWYHIAREFVLHLRLVLHLALLLPLAVIHAAWESSFITSKLI